MIEHPSTLLPGFAPTDLELVRSLPMDKLVERAIELLRKHEPPEGYYLAFSGGKDSCVIKELAKMAGVRFEAWYSQTTIDPPELARFIKEHHKDVNWIRPKQSMMSAVANLCKMPPTRVQRWCCDLYKEHGGEGRVCIFGVRAEESKRRQEKWREVTQHTRTKRPAICPIVYWTSAHVWGYILARKLPYCCLYDEGWERLGCIGCPLAGPAQQRKEFKRWPAFASNWKSAVRKNWEKWHAIPTRKGKRRMQARFKSGDGVWRWWLRERTPDLFREDCQTGLLWTNQEVEDL